MASAIKLRPVMLELEECGIGRVRVDHGLEAWAAQVVSGPAGVAAPNSHEDFARREGDTSRRQVGCHPGTYLWLSRKIWATGGSSPCSLVAPPLGAIDPRLCARGPWILHGTFL